MRIIIICLFVSVCGVRAFAQAVEQISLSKDFEKSVIAPQIWYYADTAFHSIDEIVSNPGKFVFKNDNVPVAYSKGFTRKYYWFRFVLANNTPDSGGYKLFIGKISLHRLEVFVEKNEQLSSLGVTGIDFPFHKRPYPSCYFIYPIQIGPSQTCTYYAFIDNRNHDLQAGFILFSDKQFKKFEEKTYFGFGIICGVFVFVFAVNLLLYFLSFDSLHIWYAFYILISVWQILSYEGLDYQFLFPDNPAIMNISRSLSTQLFFLVVLIVMPRYINQTRSNSRYFRVAGIMKWVMAVFTAGFIVLSMYYNNYEVNYFFGMSVKILYLAAIFILIISCIEQYKKGTRVALFYLIGIIVYLFGIMDYILFMLKLSDSIIKFPSLFQIFSLLEVIILSAGILYRYNIYRKEKISLAQMLTEAKLGISQQLLETQEAERKRIAEDLHDELGGNLAAIKMTMQSVRQNDEKSNLLMQLIDKASDSARNIAHNLMPPEFENTTLRELLDKFYLRLNTEGKICFHFHDTGNNDQLNKHHELMIYRILMEITNNIMKHSGATEATIQLIYYNKHLEIMAEDNGKGFVNVRSEGIGFKTIRSRIDYLKGKLNVDTSAKGTTIIIQLPYNTE